jgi:hypothetical protein
MVEEFNENIDQWVNDALKNPKNLATENELREQSNVALKAFLDNDANGSGTLDFEELKNLCENMVCARVRHFFCIN